MSPAKMHAAGPVLDMHNMTKLIKPVALRRPTLLSHTKTTNVVPLANC